jgi:hypothetical protein
MTRPSYLYLLMDDHAIVSILDARPFRLWVSGCIAYLLVCALKDFFSSE